MILAFLALLFSTAATLAPPPLAKLAIDEGITPKDTAALNLVVVAFIISALVYWGASYAQTYLVGWVGQRALQDLRIQLFAHLQTLSVGFYSRRQAGAIISRLTNDVQALDQLVTDGVVTLFGSTLTLVGTAAILVWLDAQLALLTFLIFPVLGIALVRVPDHLRRRLPDHAREDRRRSPPTSRRRCRASASCARSARSGATRSASPSSTRRTAAANMTTVYLNAAYFPGVELLSALATAGILLFGGIQAIQGEVTIGVLVAFVAALNNFFDPIQQLSQLYTTYQAGMAALDKIFELLDEEPDLADRPDAIQLDRLRGEIEFDDVVFRYGGEESGEAMCHINVHIPPGQTVALVGATGAGKSTFAKLVARFYDPTSGRILVDGHDLREVGAALAALADGHRAAGGVPVQRHDRRQHRVRPARRDARGDRGRRARRRRRRVHRRARARLRHRGRRARRAALGRPAPAHRLRPRADRRPAHPRARRGDLERRHPHREPRSRTACGACSAAAPRS